MEFQDRSLKHQGCNSGQVWDFLTDLGYRIYICDKKTGLPNPGPRQDQFGWTDIIAIHDLFEESDSG